MALLIWKWNKMLRAVSEADRPRPLQPLHGFWILVYRAHVSPTVVPRPASAVNESSRRRSFCHRANRNASGRR